MNDPAQINALRAEVARLRERVAYLESTDRGRLLAEAQSAHALAEQARQKADTILESITDGFVILDSGWRFTYVNGPAEKMLRHPRGELLDRVCWDLFPDAVGSQLYHQLHRAVAENRPAHFEHFYPPFQTWTDLHAYPSPEGLAVYCHDITDRKQAEAALRCSEERHRLITDLTSDYVYVSSIAADGTITLDHATEGFERVTGYTHEEVQVPDGWTKFIHPEDAANNGDVMATLLAGQRAVNEVRILTKAGEVRWIRYSSHPEWDESEGRVIRFLGAVQDITDRKRAEAKLQEYAQRLQSLSRRLLEVQEQERRYLARELHDEIGQDLTGLKLSLEMSTYLRGDALGEHLQEATRQVQDLTAKVRDLSLRLRPAMLDDLGLVPALRWHLERYQVYTHLSVRFEGEGLEGRMPAAVETAAYRIVQEALTNVARHSGASGAVVRLRVEGDRLCVQVEDGGAGFDPARVSEGRTGGLSGMYERARLLDGRFLVESCPGAGTRLTAELPLHPGEHEERP